MTKASSPFETVGSVAREPIGAPDTQRPGLAEACRRQSRLVGAADAADGEPGDLMHAALADMDDQA